MRLQSMVVSVALAVLLSSVVSAPPAVAKSEESAPRIAQRFGPGHDDPGNVSWMSVNYGGVVTGGNRLYAGSRDLLRVSGEIDFELEVEALHDGGLTASFSFQAPEEGALTTGYYERARDPDRGWLSSVRLEEKPDRCSEWGSFEIKAITPEVDRLWMIFSPGCEDGRAGGTGEVRFNMPGDPGIDAAPTAVDLLAMPVGDYTRPTAVTLMNRSDKAVRVSDVGVDGSPAWSRRWSTCATIAARDFCRVWTRFAPRSVGAHEATLRATTTAGVLSVPLRGIGNPAAGDEVVPAASEESDAPPQPAPGSDRRPRREWLMTSEPEMWVGNGRAHLFGPQDQYGVVGGDGAVIVGGRTSTSWLDGVVSVPPGEALLPGTDTQGRYLRNRLVRISGDHRGCGNYEADLRVLEADYDLFGSVERLLVTFRMNCAGDPGNLWGTIAHNALGPVPNPPGFPARSSVNAQYATRAPDAGKQFRITGKLVTRGPARPRGLVVEQREGPRKRWYQLGSTRADRTGRYTVRMRLREDAQLRVRFPGAADLAPSSSAPRWIRPR